MQTMINKLVILSILFLVSNKAAVSVDVNVPVFSKLAMEGSKSFDVNCIACHGKHAMGTEQGPPLIHPFYRPGHHDDDAIARGVKEGVIAHHWQFGDMPAIEGVGDIEIKGLIAYIRELQRANGVK